MVYCTHRTDGRVVRKDITDGLVETNMVHIEEYIMDKSVSNFAHHADAGMDLLNMEQARDLVFFEGKERIMDNLESSNAENKLASFMALFNKK